MAGPGLSGNKQHKPVVQWERHPGWTDRLVAWCNTHPSERLKLFSDSSQAAQEEGRAKETNSQSKKAIYIKLAQAIFLHDKLIKYRNLCQDNPSQFVPATEQRISL